MTAKFLDSQQTEVGLLWNEVKNTLSSEVSEDLRYNTMQMFISLFNPKYLLWNEEFEQDYLKRLDVQKKISFIPTIDSATAQKITKHFDTYLTQTVYKLRDKKKVTTGGIEIVYLILLLLRKSGNTLKFDLSSIINPIIFLLKQYPTINPFIVNVKGPDASFEDEHLVLQLLYGNCMQILVQLLSFQGTWRDSVRKPLTQRETNLKLSEIKKILLKNGILKMVKGIFNAFSLISDLSNTPLVGSQEDFLLIMLNLLGSLYQDFPATKSAALKYGFLEWLIAQFKWPPSLQYKKDQTIANDPHLKDEFLKQYLVLEVIHEATNNSHQNVKRFQELNGLKKLSKLICWVTEVFSVNNAIANALSSASAVAASSSSDQISDQMPPGRTRNRANNIILNGPHLLSAHLNYLNVNTDNAHYNKSLPLSPVQRMKCPELQMIFDLLLSMIQSWNSVDILNAILDIFSDDDNNNDKPESKRHRVLLELSKQYPELQLYVLEILTELVSKGCGYAITKKTWETLYSKYFYFCGVSEELEVLEDIKALDKPRYQLFQRMRNQVLLFTEFCSRSLPFDNFDICKTLVDILKGKHTIQNRTLIIELFVKIATSQSSNFPSKFQLPIVLTSVFKSLTLPPKDKIDTKLNIDSNLPSSSSQNDNRDQQQQQQQQQEEEAEKDITSKENARSILLKLIITLLTTQDNKMNHEMIKNEEFLIILLEIISDGRGRDAALQVLSMLMVTPTLRQASTYPNLIRLYEMFIQQLQRSSAELAIVLLKEIRKVCIDHHAAKSLFRKCGAFLSITTLLNNDSVPENLPTLCIEALKTLTSLMSQHKKNKLEMQMNVGYSSLSKLIISALDFELALSQRKLNRNPKTPNLRKKRSFTDIHTPIKDIQYSVAPLSLQLTPLLMDMLVDGNYDRIHNNTIQNPDVIFLIFSLVQSITKEMAAEMVEAFLDAVRNSSRNQSLCCEKELIYTVLGVIPSISKEESLLPKFIGLLEILGSHSITVKELKKQFLLMKSEPGDFRPFAQTQLLKSLQFMALAKGKRPSMFFDFDGQSSGLSIPTLSKFPNSNLGYSLSFWIRTSTISCSKHPRLLSFLDKDGFGIELFLSIQDNQNDTTKQLNLTYILPEKVITKELNYAFTARRWYYITLTHSNSRNLLRTSEPELRLYVNGDLKDKVVLKYPQFSHLSHNMIGCAVDITSILKKEKTIHHYIGELGAILILEGCLTTSQVTNLFQISSEISTNSRTSCFGDLESKIYLYYNCNAKLDASTFLDLTPERNREKRLNATKIGNLHSTVTSDIKDIIHCIGGVKVLLPIFAQLDMPIVPKSPNEPIDYSTNKHLLLQSIALLGDILTKSETNQLEMLRCQGFAVIGYLLQKASPVNLSSEAIMALDDLGNKIVSCSQLYDDLFLNIVFNWKIWIYASATVQWELANLLNTIANSSVILLSSSIYNSSVWQKESKKDWSKRILGVQKLLDLNYYYYWYDASVIEGAQGTDLIYHPITKELIGQRPSTAELYTIRQLTFSTLYYFIKEGITDTEITIFIKAILDNRDTLQVIELLHFLLTNLEVVPNLIDGLLRIFGINIFLGLLKREDEKIRILTLKIIGVLYYNRREIDRPFDLLILSRLLSPYPLTLDIYHVLLGMLLGSSFTEGGSSHGDNITFKTPVIVGVIFSLLWKATANIKEEILHDIYLLLNNNSANRDRFLQIPGWQHYFFVYFLTSISPPSSGGSGNLSMYFYSLVDDNLEGSSSSSDQSLGSRKTPKLQTATNMISQSAPSIHSPNPSSSSSLHSPNVAINNDDDINSPSFVHSVSEVNVQTTHPPPSGSGGGGSSNDGSRNSIGSGGSNITNSSNSNNNNSSNNNVNDWQVASQEFMFNILKILILHTFNSEKATLKAVQSIMGYLMHFCAREATPLTFYEDFTRILFTKILTTLNAVSFGQANKAIHKDIDIRSSTFLTNLIFVISIIDEFIFYTPSPKEIMALQSGKVSCHPSTYYNPLGPTSSFALHIRNGVWLDFELAKLTIYTCDAFGLLNPVNHHVNAVLDQIVKDTVKANVLRPGGLNKIMMKMMLHVIEEGDTQLCVEIMPKLRVFLEKELANYKYSNSDKVIYSLTFLMLALKRCTLSAASDPTSIDKSKTIAPFLKDLIRACIGDLPTSPAELQYFTETSTIKEFIDNIRNHPLSLVINWAEKKKSTILSEERTYAAVIDRYRNKVNSAIAQFYQREKKNEIINVRRIEDDLSSSYPRLIDKEHDRKSALLARSDSEKRLIMRTWRDLLRSLTNERAPWSTSSYSTDNKPPPHDGGGGGDNTRHWKLDRSEETFSRMRLKLKPNYNFDLHVNAVRVHHITSNDDDLKDNNDVTSTTNDDTSLSSSADNFKLFSGIKLISVDDDDGELEDLQDVSSMSSGNIDNGENSGDLTSSSNISNSSSNNNNLSAANNNNMMIAMMEKVIMSVYCELITPLKTTIGRLDISLSFIDFIEEGNNTEGGNNKGGGGMKEVKIALDQIQEIHLRRFLHRRSAIEVFLIDRKNYFLNFKKKERNKIYHKIISLNLPSLTYYQTSSSLDQILKKFDLTRKWQTRQISNFDYLMILNTIAGRSYNDLSQYPVFPWVLSDYESESIDLNNPSVYRDLSKPIGALNPKRLESFLVRYENFDEPDIPPFLYGSHYSTSGIVLNYLIRLEPFTTLYLKLQGGKFDHADRLFHSMSATWNNVLLNAADVKELIPEFFYLPEFLLNTNKFNMGITQNNEVIGDVVLPRWANGSADLFVRINRAALESDYVSANLHHWIDLIFGYKQKGRNAIEAHNVFYYLTYEGAIDIDSIEDEAQRLATEAQIDNFGQTPSQIFKKSHPSRCSPSDSHQTLLMKLSSPSLSSPRVISSSNVFKIITQKVSRSPIVFCAFPSPPSAPYSFKSPISDHNDLFVIIDESRFPFFNRFIAINNNAATTLSSPSYNIEVDIFSAQRRKIGVSFSSNIEITSSLFTCSDDGKLIVSGGHWDYSIQCSWIDATNPSKPYIQQSLTKHKDLVTCLAMTSKYLISGSKDTTVLVWELSSKSTSSNPIRFDDNPLHILYGHNSEVTSIAVDLGLNVCVSGSNDGTCIIHNLRSGVYLRSLYHPNMHPISLVAVSPSGQIAFYSRKDLLIHIYNVNGGFVAAVSVQDRAITNVLLIDQFIITSSAEYISIRSIYKENKYRVVAPSKVTSMTLSRDGTHLVAGLADGSLYVVSIEEKIIANNCNIYT